ncbi:MAG: hypothetical protein MJ187_03910, partial [Alphaproteobacteria bacterium]|nr:hypothetical protein [Alphaproteobacteria bacterium]
ISKERDLMKKSLLLLPVLALAACDNNKPKYDMTLACEDGAKGTYLVEAKIYETKADLVITRLDKELRHKSNEWLADHLWLYNKLPLIDDKIEISLSAESAFSEYTDPGHVKLSMSHGNLTGGLGFSLWHAADNNLTVNDGEKIPDGEWMVGTSCHLVVDRKLTDYGDMTPEEIKKMKNCAAYNEIQLSMDTVAPSTAAYVVYDENTGREMFISKEQMKVITNGVDFNHFVLANIRYYLEDAKHACEIADKLKAYIKEHIDEEGKPIYVAENMHCAGSDSAETTKIEIYRRYAMVYSGNRTYRLEGSRMTFDDEPTRTYEHDGIDLLAHTSANKTKIGFVFVNHRCFFDETEEDNPAQKKQTKAVDKELIDKIFSWF